MQTFRLRTFAYGSDFAPLLRGVIFGSKSALRACLDLKRVT
jgi:hypothetical protein